MRDASDSTDPEGSGVTDRTTPVGRVTAVIPTYGRPRLVRRAIESVGANADPGVPFDILVVENGGREGAEEECRRAVSAYPVRYLYVERPGKANALNVAFGEMDADFVVQYDDDVRVGPVNVASYVAAARRYGRGHFFGGPLHADYEEAPPHWLVPFLPPSARGWALGDQERQYDFPDFIGSNWAVFRDDVRETGGFGAELGPRGKVLAIGGEETDLQRRMLRRGAHGVYVPEAEVWHHVPRDRCTLAWTLDRRYREHLARALDRRDDPAVPSAGGVPLWLWKQWALRSARVMLARALGRDWSRRVADEMKLVDDRGAIRGYQTRAARRRQAAAQPATE